MLLLFTLLLIQKMFWLFIF